MLFLFKKKISYGSLATSIKHSLSLILTVTTDTIMTNACTKLITVLGVFGRHVRQIGLQDLGSDGENTVA